MNKLRAMFYIAAVMLVGGVSYTVAILKPGFKVADAIDAGILPISVPMQLQCRVRIKTACKRADGGAYPTYATVNIKARKITLDGGGANRIIALDVPDSPDDGGSCILPVGGLREACTVVENGACTDATVCCANCLPQPAQDQCACRMATGGGCRYADGGLLPFGATIQAGLWRTDGGGCFRKYCGPEIAGEQGGSWPVQCPRK